jgi:hypothetical protein
VDTVRDLAEQICALLALDTGRVELVVNKGSLREVYRHEKIKPTDCEALATTLLERAAAAKPLDG